MLAPLIVNQNKGQTATAYSIPSPVGGLNARDSIAEMKPEDALILTNVFPEETEVRVRGGFDLHRTGLDGAVETLMVWNGPTSSKLLVVNDGDVGDVSATGSAPTAIATSLTSDRFQYTNFSNSAGNFIIAVNGADDPKKYDGTTFSTTTITASGLTAANLIYVNSHKERLWFVEKNSMNAWYLETQAISGTAVKFPLGAVFSRGGYLVASGTMSADSGDGPDDYLAFLSSEGEIALYAGTDPSSASTWSLVGVYRAGRPIGQRPLTKLGGDLLALTKDGVISIKKMSQLDRSESQYAAVTNKINRLINSAARNFSDNFGWEVTVYPVGKWLILNVPQSAGSLQFQYVMNILTGAWCKFENMKGNCWAVYDDELYFGGNDGKIYKADSGKDDNGANIEFEIKTAFNYFRSKGKQKQFTLARPIIESTGTPQYAIGMDVDFQNTTPSGLLSVNTEAEAMWDSATWDNSEWGGASNILKDWTSIQGIGFCGSVHMIGALKGQTCAVYSFDVLANPGGVL